MEVACLSSKFSHHFIHHLKPERKRRARPPPPPVPPPAAKDIDAILSTARSRLNERDVVVRENLAKHQYLSEWKQASMVRFENLPKISDKTFLEGLWQHGLISGYRRKECRAIVEFSEVKHAEDCVRCCHGMKTKGLGDEVKTVFVSMLQKKIPQEFVEQ